MFARLSTGLVAAILLVGLCAVGVRAVTATPSVTMTFHNGSQKTMKVQLIGEGGLGYNQQTVAADGNISYVFSPNPHIVTVQVSGCLAESQLVIAKMYTRVYSKVATGIGSDCKLYAPVNTP